MLETITNLPAPILTLSFDDPLSALLRAPVEAEGQSWVGRTTSNLLHTYLPSPLASQILAKEDSLRSNIECMHVLFRSALTDMSLL